MAHWHGLAKLRMHTDYTLEILDHTTTQLGQLLRDFHLKTCTSFNTQELPREANARDHRKTKTRTKKKDVTSLPTEVPIPQDVSENLAATVPPTCSPGTSGLNIMCSHVLSDKCRYRYRSTPATTTQGQAKIEGTEKPTWLVSIPF